MDIDFFGDSAREKRDVREKKESIEIERQKEIQEILYAQRKALENLKPKNTLSFIEEHEEEEGKRFVNQQLGFNIDEVFRPIGWFMLVKIWYPEDYLRLKEVEKREKEEPRIISPTTQSINSSSTRLILPESAFFYEKCKSCTALVVAMGPACYKGEKFEHWNNGVPKVGDFVVLPRNEGNRIVVKGFDMIIFYDDKVKAIVKNPEDVVIE